MHCVSIRSVTTPASAKKATRATHSLGALMSTNADLIPAGQEQNAQIKSVTFNVRVRMASPETRTKEAVDQQTEPILPHLAALAAQLVADEMLFVKLHQMGIFAHV